MGHDRPGAPIEVRCLAPAKLNLYLHITGRRADGYHLIDSLFVFPETHDVIVARSAEAISLQIDGPFADAVPAGGDNLVLVAARALWDFMSRRSGDRFRPGATICLTKNLPPATGIGGGSADAAAALRALRRLWDVAATEDEFLALAQGIGADVPACLVGGALQVSGIGEILRPVPMPPDAHIVLANPGVPLSTADMFGDHRRAEIPFSDPAPILGSGDPPRNLAALVATLTPRRNDLEPLARRRAPEIGTVIAALGDLDGCLLARMSGSGATCFGLFAAPEQAKAGAEALRVRSPAWWIAQGRLLKERPPLTVISS